MAAYQTIYTQTCAHIYTYSYFEKGCQIKHMWQPKNVLWVVLSSLFFKEISERIAGEAMDICLRVQKKATKIGSTAIVSGIVYWAYPILPLGIVLCTFFPTNFLAIAVYTSTYYTVVWFADITTEMTIRQAYMTEK